ncbi:MAG: hypothetical protein ABH859_06785 [Pseudomonadota bacterium]
MRSIKNNQILRRNMRTLPCQSNKLIEKELVRKMLHLPVFIFPFIALNSTLAALAVLILLAAGYLVILIYEKQFNKTVPILSTIILYCRRSTDYDLGPIYLALGMIVALCLTSPRNVFYAAYVIAICDSAASLIGMRFGRKQIPIFGKSYLGSLAFFATCFLGGLFYLTPLMSLVAALCLVVIELISIKGLDNFTLPVVSQILLLLMV